MAVVELAPHHYRKKEFLTNGSLGVFGSVELDNASATGTAIGLVLDLRTLDLADGGEEFDEIFVAGRPGKLKKKSASQRSLRLHRLTLRT